MPRTNLFFSNFSAGEVSPLLRGRTDFARYQRGAKRIQNFLVLLQGGLEKRHGTRYVATAGIPTAAVRLSPFIFRAVDALVLEWGDQYVRFYKNGARVESPPGTPVEIATPYLAADVFALRFAQKNDVVYITHRSYPPQKLQRLSDTSWAFAGITSVSPPTNEAGFQPNVGLTLSAVSGTAVTCTASGGVFLDADLDREITSGIGLGIITGLTSSTVCTLHVVQAFSSVNIAAGDWTLTGSPVAQLLPSKAKPQGATVTLLLGKEQPNAPELVTNGDFASGLTGWTNASAATVATGTADSAIATAELIDSTADFVAAGVQVGQVIQNTTDGSAGTVTEVTTTVVKGPLEGGATNQWNLGDAYIIKGTGSVVATTGAAVLFGGDAGIAEIWQSLATVAGQRYRATFDVVGNPLSLAVGTTATSADILSEATYDLGSEQVAIFTATSATTFLRFRNNQSVNAVADNVSCKLYGINGWRVEDVGRWVFLNGGLVQILTYVSPTEVTGQIQRELTTAAEAAAGAWTLEGESWNGTDGYPGYAVFHEQRLIYLSSPQFPQTVWGSGTNDYENLARGILADEPFEYTLAEAQGFLHWAIPGQQLIIGAENGPFKMAGDQDTPIVASAAPSVVTLGDYGTSAIEGLRVGHSLLYVQRQGTKLREFTFQQLTFQYQPPEDLSALSEHLFRTDTVVQMAYAQEPLPLVWVVRGSGSPIALTYDKIQQVTAWHNQPIGGGLVRSVAVIPHPTLNAHQTWFVVERVIGGVTTQYIEVIDDTAVGVDSAVVYTGAGTTQLTGLDHLEGEAVSIAGIPATGTHWAVFMGQVVGAGLVTIRDAGGNPIACTQAYAGVRTVSILDTLPPEIPGAVTIQRQRKRWQEVYVSLFESGVGLFANGQRIDTRPLAQLMDDGIEFVTGDYSVPNLGWDLAGILTVTHAEPLPCTLLMVGGALEISDS